MSKLTFWGQLFCQTIAKRSDDCPNRTICTLWEGAFSCVGSHVSCLQDPSENAHYEVKYSALYFTWKLAEICAKILTRMLPP